MNYERVIDTGYVVDIPEKETYYQSNTGIFKTRRHAENLCKWAKAHCGFNCEVRKVALVIVEDNVDEG